MKKEDKKKNDKNKKTITESEIKLMDKKFPKGHYDRNGKEIGLGTWSKLLEEDEKYRIVKQEKIKIGKKVYFVSSIWLGIDYGFEGKKPVIFETMIFKRNKILDSLGDSIYQERYCTEKETVANHKKIIELLKTGKFCKLK